MVEVGQIPCHDAIMKPEEEQSGSGRPSTFKFWALAAIVTFPLLLVFFLVLLPHLKKPGDSTDEPGGPSAGTRGSTSLGSSHAQSLAAAHGLALARLACPRPTAEKSKWLLLVRGMADYRDGHFEEALAILRRAVFRDDPVTQARALAIQAMASHQLGRHQEAVATAQEAQTQFAQGAARGAGWKDAAFSQLALKELLTVLARPSPPK
jgi:hypothetical protein